jgi:hypothetical protein
VLALTAQAGFEIRPAYFSAQMPRVGGGLIFLLSADLDPARERSRCYPDFELQSDFGQGDANSAGSITLGCHCLQSRQHHRHRR